MDFKYVKHVLPVFLGATALLPAADPTTTPIQHVVVIFQENVSFDHYFGTYPKAANTDPTEPAFHAKDDTPAVNGLMSAGLLTQNPNSAQPKRLSRSQAVTCDQDHNAIAGSLLPLFDFDHEEHADRLILDPATGLPMHRPSHGKDGD